MSPLHVFLLHFLSELVTQQRKFHIERFHNRAICLARSGDLKFMGMGQLAMCCCKSTNFLNGLDLDIGMMLCYNIVGGARLVSTV